MPHIVGASGSPLPALKHGAWEQSLLCMYISRRKRKLLKSVAAGALGGLAASFVMNQFQALWSKTAKRVSNNGADEKTSPSEDEDATIKIARRISRTIAGHELSEDDKKWAGPVVHYAFGTLIGAAYGALAETAPAFRSGFGAAYGGMVWLGADEVAVPALRLSRPALESPLSSHAEALASHIVYGVTTDLARRAILKI